MELELDELEDKRELLLDVAGTTRLDDELEITADDWLDLDELRIELGTELWLDGVTDAR
jgi:hypothetical protein